MARERRHGVRFFLLVLVLAFGQGCLAAFAAGPEQAVAMLQKGIETRNLALVEKHLDLDGAVGKAVDAAITDEEFLREAGRNPNFAIVLALGGATGANDAFRDLLASEVREYVRHGVVSGAFAGKPVDGASTYKGLFGKAFRGGEKNKVVFGPAAVKKSGKSEALVTTVLSLGAKERRYPLELRVARQQEAWRVVEVVNAAELARSGREKGSQ